MARCGATFAMRCAIADQAAGAGPWATWGQIMGQMAMSAENEDAKFQVVIIIAHRVLCGSGGG